MKADAYRGQVVIITGASAGIGKALALHLARQGAKLAIAVRRIDRLEQVATECRGLGGEVLAVPTDVSEESQCKELVEKTVGVFDGLDMLINNAGLAVLSFLADYPDLQLFRHTMNVNFYGAVNCTYYALPYLKQTQGRIVAISSVGGKAAIPYNTPYCASKYALHGFYDALRMEVSGSGVSATVICPWWVVTEFHEAQMDKNGVPYGPRGRAIYSRRMMSADRCAEITLRAAYNRRREVLMGPGTLIVWLKLLSPRLMDWMALAFLKSAARRTQKGVARM